MRAMKMFIAAIAATGMLFSSVAMAETGTLLKLLKPAKMHVEASGPSEVSEIVWKGKTAVQLDKSGGWVQIRMQDTGHSGWVHEQYLAPLEAVKAEVVPVKQAEDAAAAAPEVAEEKVAETVVQTRTVVTEAAQGTVETVAPVTEQTEVVAAESTRDTPAAEPKPVRKQAKKKESGHHGPVLQHADVDVTDQEQLRRGLTVFTDVCMGCHSAKYITWRGLMDYPEIGLSREAVDELRGDKSLMSGMISDLSTEDAVVSYGKAPPDLSLIVPGRRGGADYVYSLLTGYEHDPNGKVPDGNYNGVFPGNRIAMPDPLSWLDHEADETEELKQQAEDVAAFLAFIADPHQNTRHEIGKWVMGFLLLLTFVLWRLKVEVWRDVKH